MNSRGFIKFTIALLLVSSICSIPVRTQAQAAPVAAGITISTFLQSLNETIRQLEQSASFLLSQGNNAAAQQQMLLAGILRELVSNVKSAYADSLNLTFEQVNVTAFNASMVVLQAIGDVSRLEASASKDVQQAIYKAQGAANQVLDRIPLIKRVPIFYGITSHDLLDSSVDHPADIEMYGFHLIDDKLEYKAPRIKVYGNEIPSTFVSVQSDRLQIKLPEDIKKKIGFGFSPCDTRKAFQVEATIYYGVDNGIFWPFTSTGERNVTFSGFTLPDPDVFDVTVSYNGTRTTHSSNIESFSVQSGEVKVGCEEGGGGTARFEAPANATELNCSSGWVETSNLKNTGQNCAVGGTVATATGTIRGRDRDCVPVVSQVLGLITGPKYSCNCPGGGHGALQLSGTYRVPVTSTDPAANGLAGAFALTSESASYTLPSDTSLKLSNVIVEIHRKSCSAQFDALRINVPDNTNLAVSQASEKGYFSTKYQFGQLMLTKASKY